MPGIVEISDSRYYKIIEGKSGLISDYCILRMLMAITMILVASENDYPMKSEVWELSVRATYHFLPENYLQEIKALLPFIFHHAAIYLWQDENNSTKGFARVSVQKIEMLFIHPDSIGHGIGRKFAEY